MHPLLVASVQGETALNISVESRIRPMVRLLLRGPVFFIVGRGRRFVFPVVVDFDFDFPEVVEVLEANLRSIGHNSSHGVSFSDLTFVDFEFGIKTESAQVLDQVARPSDRSETATRRELPIIEKLPRSRFAAIVGDGEVETGRSDLPGRSQEIFEAAVLQQHVPVTRVFGEIVGPCGDQ